MAPIPVAAAARRFRLSLCLTAPPLAPQPAQQAARAPDAAARDWQHPRAGRIPGAAPGTVPPLPAAGPAFHWALELSIRPQKARGLLLCLFGLVAARRPCK